MPLRRWIAGAFAIALTAAAIAFIAYGAPDPLWRALAGLTGATNLLPPSESGTVRVHSSRWPQDFGVLPAEVRKPLSATDPVGRVRELRERPGVLVETATLVAPAGSERLTLVTPALTLRDATLVTNGADLEIETEKLDALNSTIRAFPADAAGGGPERARNGGTVRITVRGTMNGILRVDLSGQAGAAGQAGGPVSPGTRGAPGDKARSGATECAAPAGRGRNGGPGGRGEPGGTGRDGGDGGSLDVFAADPAAASRTVLFSAPAGRGGPGGAGGAGGPGGAGGAGGDPAGVCFGSGPTGFDGPRGPAGPAGEPGRAGANGEMRVRPLGG